MRFGSAVQFLQAVGPQTERGRERTWRKTRELAVSYFTYVTLNIFLCSLLGYLIDDDHTGFLNISKDLPLFLLLLLLLYYER